jgi:predicted nucleic acid-binding protein
MLVDTGAWYAVADRSDRHHTEARRFYLKEAPRGQLITTDLVLSETWTLIDSHLGRAAALRFWDTLRVARIPILPLESVDLEAAWHIAQAVPDQTFSVTDCTSFAVMERLGIHDAFAFDAHFLVYRFGPRRERAFRRWPA